MLRFQGVYRFHLFGHAMVEPPAHDDALSLSRQQRWDIFCKVVDNYGDIGTCWRLARQLADEYSCPIRLWVDDLVSFSQICPLVSHDASSQHVGSIEVRTWDSCVAPLDVAQIVIEAFACEIPSSYVQAMGQQKTAPIWINLEYLSAEDWVQDCHLLKSPHSDLPLSKHFFFPGVSPRTGGLLKESTLSSQQASFDKKAKVDYWRELKIPNPLENELRVSLFCYENPRLPELLDSFAKSSQPDSLLVCPGHPTEQIARWLDHAFSPGSIEQKGSLAIFGLPFIPQERYDRLLWGCDVNFVRGEDSFVRAQWAPRPFVWQIYPQSDDAHLIKLDAFLNQFLKNFPDSDHVRTFWNAWNGSPQPISKSLPAAWECFLKIRPAFERHTKVWASQLDQTGHLADNLIGFVRGKLVRQE